MFYLSLTIHHSYRVCIYMYVCVCRKNPKVINLKQEPRNKR